MIRNRCYGSCELKVELSALGMSFCNCVNIFEYAVHEVVNVCFRNNILCNNNSAYCNCLDVFGCAVSFFRDCVLCVERRLLDKSCDMLVIKAEDVYFLGCCEGSNSSCRSACNDERSVDLAILKGFCGVAEGLVSRVDIGFTESVCFKNIESIEVCSGTCSADGRLQT